MNLVYSDSESENCILDFLATCDFVRNRVRQRFTTADATTVNHTKWKPAYKMDDKENSSIEELHSRESVQASNTIDSEASIDEADEWLQTVFSRVKDLIYDYFQQTRHHVIYEILISAIALILFIAYKMSKTNTELPRRRTRRRKRRRTKNKSEKRIRNKSDNLESS